MFRFCLVGFGRWGKIYYNTISRLDYCIVDCILLSGLNKINDSYGDINVPFFYSIEDVIKVRKIHGFIIATPPDTHFKLAKSCLINKYPVLIEKPFTENYSQASALVEIAKLNKTVCMVGYQHLFAENHLFIKKLIDFKSNNLSIYSEGLSEGPVRESTSVFRDWGSHEIAIALNLYNEMPISYRIQKIAGVKRDDIRGVYFMELDFSRGRIFSSLFGNISEFKRRTLLIKQKSTYVYINGLDQGGCLIMKNGLIINPESILSRKAMPVDLLIKSFVYDAKLNILNLESLNHALQVVSLLDKIESVLNMENYDV